jgi:hypothetical protein
MSVLRSRFVLWAWSAFLFSGCSGSEQPEVAQAPIISVFASQAAAGDAGEAGDRRSPGEDDVDPVVESVRFEPAQPASRARLRAVVKISGRWTSAEFEWDVNGQTFASNTSQVVLPVIATGDIVSVRVVPVRGVRRGEEKVVSVRVRNQSPMLLGLQIERAEAGSASSSDAEMWRAAVRAEDPDGDPLEIEYRWSVNGVASRVRGELFPVADLTRGDRLEVSVRVFDGSVWSPPARSGQVEVGNSPPTIVSRPPRPDALGNFRYQIRAEDSDGDLNIRFSLRKAPQGMRIDEINGIVTWRPNTDQAGRHAIEVVATDEGGAESTQSFSLALVRRSDADNPGPAAAR